MFNWWHYKMTTYPNYRVTNNFQQCWLRGLNIPEFPKFPRIVGFPIFRRVWLLFLSNNHKRTMGSSNEQFGLWTDAHSNIRKGDQYKFTHVHKVLVLNNRKELVSLLHWFLLQRGSISVLSHFNYHTTPGDWTSFFKKRGALALSCNLSTDKHAHASNQVETFKD